MKIAICIPCHGDAKLGFTVSLARLMAYSARALPDAELEILTESSAILPDSRAKLLEKAEKLGARFVLWLDADMTFPPDTLERLLSHKARFVGTNALGDATAARLPGPPTKSKSRRRGRKPKLVYWRKSGNSALASA